MTEVFRSEAHKALGSFVLQVVVASVGISAGVVIAFDHHILIGLPPFVIGLLFGHLSKRNLSTVRRYIQTPPRYEEEKRHYDEEHNIS